MSGDDDQTIAKRAPPIPSYPYLVSEMSRARLIEAMEACISIAGANAKSPSTRALGIFCSGRSGRRDERRLGRLDDLLSQFLDLPTELGIDGDLAAHRVAGMQNRRVIAVKPTPDLRQADAAQHLKAQQHSDVPGQHDVRQAAPAEQLRARQPVLFGDGVLNELERHHDASKRIQSSGERQPSQKAASGNGGSEP